jgi:hypothetical protein
MGKDGARKQDGNHPSGAKAHYYFAAFAAVRVKTLTYQSCPDTNL